MENLYPSQPLNIGKAARLLHVPVNWLRAEIEAGRLPALRAGRVFLIHVPTVAELLAKRAKEGGSL